jgi:hypothetical protein
MLSPFVYLYNLIIILQIEAMNVLIKLGNPPILNEWGTFFINLIHDYSFLKAISEVDIPQFVSSLGSEGLQIV